MSSVACSLQKPALVVRQVGPTRVVAQRQAVRVMAHKQEHKVMPPGHQLVAAARDDAPAHLLLVWGPRAGQRGNGGARQRMDLAGASSCSLFGSGRLASTPPRRPAAPRPTTH